MSEGRGKMRQTGRLKDNSPRRAPSSSKRGGGKEDKIKYIGVPKSNASLSISSE